MPRIKARSDSYNPGGKQSIRGEIICDLGLGMHCMPGGLKDEMSSMFI